MSTAPPKQMKKSIPAMLADTDLLFKQSRQGSAYFTEASPFPHLLIQGMIKRPCCTALYEGLRQWVEAPSRRDDFYPLANLPSVVQMLLWELSSSTLTRHFASLAGTPPLLPDPHLLQGGILFWQEPSVLHGAAGEYIPRHPQTDLQNALRLEMFFTVDPQAAFDLQLLSETNDMVNALSVSTGALLMTRSDQYRMRYVVAEPSQWASLLCFYYVNDRARILNNQEQPGAY